MSSRELLETKNNNLLDKLNFNDNSNSTHDFGEFEEELKALTPNLPYMVIKPEAGFCLKTKNINTKSKVFINICHSQKVPCPKNITDSDLIKLLESDDPTEYKIPMSIGEPHAEVDKSNVGCTVYDVVVNTNMMDRFNSSQMLQTFFLTVTLEGIEYKYNVSLDKNCIRLKNRKNIGMLQEQHLRTKSKPIEDLGDDAVPGINKNVSEISKINDDSKAENLQRLPEPIYTIIREPADGHPNYLISELKLPKIKTAASLELEIGEDRIVLKTRSNTYFLDIFLPFNLVQENCGAQFDRTTQVLTITMPVQPL